MILYQNSLMILDYDPATDILNVDWPNAEFYLLSEVRFTLLKMADYIKHYDVKRLLIDASKTKSNPELLNSDQYREIVLEFTQNLTKTRLQKSARIAALDQSREEKTREITANLQQKTNYQFESKTFASKTEARNWLLA